MKFASPAQAKFAQAMEAHYKKKNAVNLSFRWWIMLNANA